ncbi:hypothetical protein A359_02240 [secondary endosymbiont of Ctenarytaina eucalypti]|uniref:Uncharacterized protein n=1 Tax=secondary endosymbiont of Ctenarytaina eucalypti TaxID=1199245 RepID=J3TX22_9ENTR|nr:hypothetical protein A359_02240 [secondary endosymbiont of Ctenarytaina eucalypti]
MAACIVGEKSLREIVALGVKIFINSTPFRMLRSSILCAERDTSDKSGTNV